MSKKAVKNSYDAQYVNVPYIFLDYHGLKVRSYFIFIHLAEHGRLLHNNSNNINLSLHS